MSSPSAFSPSSFGWQIPHFLAISVYRAGEYRRAGFPVYANTMGFGSLCAFAAATSLVLVAATLVPVVLGLKSGAYAPVCVASGVLFVAAALAGFRFVGRPEAERRGWARMFFYASLLYLPVVLGAFIFF